ncbi:hypothetical protein OROMI_014359 [Orobanche minor]
MCSDKEEDDEYDQNDLALMARSSFDDSDVESQGLAFYHWDPAQFVGRSEILAWINSTLHLNLSKVEEACTGAV